MEDNYIKKENQHPLISELEDLAKDIPEWQSEGRLLDKVSIKNAIRFISNSLITKKLPIPHVEVHPDGEIAFTWRKQNSGIINIAFDKEGIATWAAYLLNNKKMTRTIKGRFYVQDAISDVEKNIIMKISGPSKNKCS